MYRALAHVNENLIIAFHAWEFMSEFSLGYCTLEFNWNHWNFKDQLPLNYIKVKLCVFSAQFHFQSFLEIGIFYSDTQTY